MKLSPKIPFIVGFIIIVILIIQYVIPMIASGDKAELKRLIYTCKALIENEDLTALREYVSNSYNDESGNNKRRLLITTDAFFKLASDIKITAKILEISIEDGLATCYVQIAAYWNQPQTDRTLSSNLSVKGRLQKEDGVWKLIDLKFFQ